MASGVHSVYPQIPPAYPQHAHTASLNGSFTQGPIGSFDAGHSVASTPAPTPPQPRPGSQQQVNYGMNGGSASNGMMPPSGYGYADPNMFNQSPYYQNGVKPQPQIYTVFEMEVNGVAVMRRRNDGWLNATQILKVAGVDKGKRTKVLEKEVQNGQHEKVQGGYGKYQGTWINYQRGREFCRSYGVEELLLPLLEYDLSADGGNQTALDTPTKEQAMAAQRKRMYGGQDRSAPQNGGGTFFKSMSSTAANAINALNRTRVDSPSRMDGRRSAGPRRPSQPSYGQDSLYGGSQQSMQSLHSQDSFGNNGVLSQAASFADFPGADEPPRKRMRPSPANSFMNSTFDANIDMSLQDGSPTELNQSFMSQPGPSFDVGRGDSYGLEPLPHPAGPGEERKRDLLMNLFLENTATDFDDHPAFLQLSGDEYEVPIDANCNTALHWAATLGRVPLVKKLLDKGFNQKRTNSGGETALVAACRARNNFDQSTFPQLLELLGPSIETRDGRGRTLLHHIAVSSAMKGRAAVGRYYLESLLEFVVRQGSSQNTTGGHSMTLARFMQEIVNAQDKAGDTALNLAARSSTKTIIDQLIEVGADPGIENRGGLAPHDFGVGSDGSPNHHRDHGVASFRSDATVNGHSQSTVGEAQETLLSSIREVLSQSEQDFEKEVKEMQEALDKTNAALKESGSSLAEERRKFDSLRSKAREKDVLHSKIRNLQRSIAAMNDELSGKNITVKEAVVLGEADKGLDFDGTLAGLSALYPELDDDFDPATADVEFLASTLDPATIDQLSKLESATVLSARVKAYKSHNATLETQAKQLRGKSSELEERYRKIVSLCTGTPEQDVESLIDSLVQAVVSEQKDGAAEGEPGQLSRVRDFLRMLKGK